MRLLCDEMLARLARWLRAAGHDAAMGEPGAPDEALLAMAEAEDRLLVTKAPDLAQRAGPRGVLICGDGADAEASSLTQRLRLGWRLAPFTRCVMDNAVLRPATPEEIGRMPQSTRALGGPFNACPACGRLYWPGSHVRRMTEQLARWDEAGAAAGSEPYDG
jgi:uncharacterized protein with PIN domain